MDLTSCLVSMGLTSNEAALYRILSMHGEMTGYECAKLTGISRSNVYLGLSGLCEKGGAFTIDGTAQKYSPTPIREFCANKRREFDTAANFVLEHMPLPSSPSSSYITISGAASIIDKMKNMISACAERLYISAETNILTKVIDELADVVERGHKVVLMTDSDFNLNGAIMYSMTRKEGQIRLIVDSCFVLTGDIAEEQPCSCLFSSSKTLVSLFKDAMKNEIRLIELGELK